MSAGQWAHDMADSYAKMAKAFEGWPDTDRTRLGAAANRAEEAKYRRIAKDMDDAVLEPSDPSPGGTLAADGEREHVREAHSEGSHAMITLPRRRVIVALDIDGVVAPLAPPATQRNTRVRPVRDVEPHWGYRWVDDLHFGTLLANPVISLLRDLQEAGHVEPHWHSSWWIDAWDINTWLKVPRWPMLATEGEYLRDEQHLPGRTIDWKSNSVLRTLASLGPNDVLVWVEDEIEFFAERDRIAHLLEADPRLVMIQPHSYSGVTSTELALIRAAARI